MALKCGRLDAFVTIFPSPCLDLSYNSSSVSRSVPRDVVGRAVRVLRLDSNRIRLISKGGELTAGPLDSSAKKKELTHDAKSKTVSKVLPPMSLERSAHERSSGSAWYLHHETRMKCSRRW